MLLPSRNDPEDLLLRLSPILLSMLVLAGCSGGKPATNDARPNILLISIDALRADHLSYDGYTRPTTPFLDELAAEGTRFSHAFVNTHGTPPSHTTMLSSLYQEGHRVGFGAGTAEGRDDHIPPEVELVQEILQRAGWHTIAVTGGGYMADVFGFDRGFDVFNGGLPAIEDGSRRLLSLLDKRPRKPVFALLHTYEVHSPYEPPEAYAALWDTYSSDVPPTNEALKPIQKIAGDVLDDEDFCHLEALYDGGIRYTDDVLRDLFGKLTESGFLDNSLVIITADHGEEFGDHGGVLHGSSLFEELLRVPLIVFGSGVPRATVDPRLVSLVDLAPTILAAAGLPVPEQMEGRNLFDGAAAPPEHEQRVFAQYADILYAVRTPRWKLVQSRNGYCRLYDLKTDPRELRNVKKRHQDIAEQLRAELEQWKQDRVRVAAERGERPQLSPEKIEELRALGYTE